MHEVMLFSNNQLRNRILDCLLKEAYLEEYSISRRDNSLYKKDGLGWFRISIANSWSSVDLDRDSQFCLCITPGYSRRFDVLHKWFEPFAKTPIKEERKSASVMMGYKSGKGYFDFLRSGNGFEIDFKKLNDTIYQESIPFFTNNLTLDDYYQTVVLPGIQGRKELRKDTVFWTFQWLMATRIVAQESYAITKEILTDYLYNSPFPISKIFMSNYEKSYPAIINALETYDYKKDL
jgi:hypothetical protein